MKFDRLEAARGFAAAYVCLSHVVPGIHGLEKLGVLFRFGQEAVMLFFVLSGFVIFWSTPSDTNVLNRKACSEYFLKRFVRIYSVWFLAVLVMAVIASVTVGRAGFDSLYTVIGNFLMLQDFGYVKPAVICDPIFGDGPLWSLHYEWWFYVMFPFALCLKSTYHRAHAVGILGIVGSLSYLAVPNPVSRLCMYFTIWWIGAHAASVRRSGETVTLSSVAIPLIYVIATALPQLIPCVLRVTEGSAWSIGTHPFLEIRHLLTSVVIVLVAFGWKRINWIGFNWSIGLFKIVAPISFSLYVIHFKSIADATYLRFIGNGMLEFLGYVALTLLFCGFSELVFFPFVRRRLVRRSQVQQ